LSKIFRFLFILFIIILLSQGKVILADLDNQILTAQQAEEQALTVDSALQEAKLNLEIAKKNLETAKKIFSVSSSINLQKQTYGSQDLNDITKGLNLISGGDPAEIYPKWTVSANETDVAPNQGQTFSLQYAPFKLALERKN
jgi:hypothetical protein